MCRAPPSARAETSVLQSAPWQWETKVSARPTCGEWRISGSSAKLTPLRDELVRDADEIARDDVAGMMSSLTTREVVQCQQACLLVNSMRKAMATPRRARGLSMGGGSENPSALDEGAISVRLKKQRLPRKLETIGLREESTRELAKRWRA